MEKKLSDAAMEGDIAFLRKILQEDPLLLHRAVVSCISDTPLHISAMLGHLAFVKEILTLNSELASELDSRGCSPLHLAAVKGHLEIVKELLKVDPEMCTVRNQDGRTPLHLAAIKGRVKVATELVRVRPESTSLLTDRGETVLHLCVAHDRLMGLKSLFEEIGRDDELVNWKDCDCNTVLHVAVTRKQIEIIRFLVSITGLDVNALNRSGSTALDILMQSPRDLRDLEIEGILRDAGALRAKDLHIIVHELGPSPTKGRPNITRSPVSRVSLEESNSAEPVAKHKHTDWLGRKRSALMVVASLIATVAFQAAITPPGGVWQDDLVVDSNGNSTSTEEAHLAGTSVMAYKDKIAYGQFMIFNTIAFLASLSIILLLVSGLPIKRRRWMWIQMVIMWIAITAQVVTYFISLRYMSPNNVYSALRDVTEISVLAWLGLMGVVFIGNLIRMNLWILRKFGYIKEKEPKPAVAAVDDDQDEL